MTEIKGKLFFVTKINWGKKKKKVGKKKNPSTKKESKQTTQTKAAGKK